MGIEVAGAPKNFRRNLIFLGGGPWLIQGMIGEVAQQFAQGLGTMQSMTAKEFFDLSPVMSLVRHLPPLVRHCNTNVTLFALH
jgi:hypothetical protein